MLKKVQIFKALDIEIKKQKGPIAVKDPYKGHHSLKEELGQPGITLIGEVAGGNPLRGQVRESYRASTHAKSLVENGARALSIATDRFLYYGDDKHLGEVRSACRVPLLRRDFIFEEYQIEESKILGADAIFLMAVLLETERLRALIKLAVSKGLDVVVEVASDADLQRALEAGADIICVVGRDLDTWEPSWEKALILLEKIPSQKCLRIVEAGIDQLSQIEHMEGLGVHGIIIGDALLDEFYPGKRLQQIKSGMEIPRKPAKAPKAKPVEDDFEDEESDAPRKGKGARKAQPEAEEAPAPKKPTKKTKAEPAAEEAPAAKKPAKKAKAEPVAEEAPAPVKPAKKAKAEPVTEKAPAPEKPAKKAKAAPAAEKAPAPAKPAKKAKAAPVAEKAPAPEKPAKKVKAEPITEKKAPAPKKAAKAETDTTAKKPAKKAEAKKSTSK